MTKRLSILATTLLSLALLVVVIAAARVGINVFTQLTPSNQAASKLPGDWTIGTSTFTFNRDGTGLTTYAHDGSTKKIVWQDRNGELTIQIIGANGPPWLELLGGRHTTVLNIDSMGNGAVRLTDPENGRTMMIFPKTRVALNPQ